MADLRLPMSPTSTWRPSTTKPSRPTASPSSCSRTSSTGWPAPCSGFRTPRSSEGCCRSLLRTTTRRTWSCSSSARSTSSGLSSWATMRTRTHRNRLISRSSTDLETSFDLSMIWSDSSTEMTLLKLVIMLFNRGPQSTEVAFALLTQRPWVRILAQSILYCLVQGQ